MSSLLEPGSVLSSLPKVASINAGTIHRFGARWSVSLLLTAGMSGVFTMLMIVTLGLTRFPAPPDLAVIFGFNRCGGLACFRGLIPGVTPWVEARAAFNNRLSIPFDPPDGEILLIESIDGQTLGRILIRLPNDGSLLVSGVVGLFGPPCGVTIYPQSRKFTLRYATARFVSYDNQTALSPNTPIFFVELGDPSYSGNGSGQDCLEERAPENVEIANRRWRGFVSLDRYFQHGSHVSQKGYWSR